MSKVKGLKSKDWRLVTVDWSPFSQFNSFTMIPLPLPLPAPKFQQFNNSTIPQFHDSTIPQLPHWPILSLLPPNLVHFYNVTFSN